jgi:Flp pilus assembly protein TadB
VAQTKRRRRRKRRGTQGGRVDTRQRGRPRNRAEAKQRARARSGSGRDRQRGLQRTAQPPSWRTAFWKGLAAAAIFFVLIAVAFGRGVSEALPVALAMLAFYVPLAYLTDRFFFNRQLRKEQKEREQAQQQG